MIALRKEPFPEFPDQSMIQNGSIISSRVTSSAEVILTIIG